jgi:hypothetical protein
MADTASSPSGFQRRLTADENDVFNGACVLYTIVYSNFTRCLPSVDASEVRNERALAVYHRVQNKLTGLHLPLQPPSHTTHKAYF